MSPDTKQRPTLLQRLDAGPVICAEGYLFELERRGYLQAGAFVPRWCSSIRKSCVSCIADFVHAGSDVVEALTYYTHREKLRVIGREADLEPINRRALEIAKSVATETGALFAGDICNTNVYDPADRGIAPGRARRCSRNRSAGRWKPASTTLSERLFPTRRRR